MSAKIIFLEGPNYCGKSTIIKALLSELLHHQNKTVYTTCEPGGDLFGTEIRKLLLDKELNDACKMAYQCRRLLYAASHTQLLQTLEEKINEYDYIIVDRYNPISDLIYGPMQLVRRNEREMQLEKSKLVYQTFDNKILKDNAAFIFLDISLSVLRTRIADRNVSENKLYDYKSDAFKEHIWACYTSLMDDLATLPNYSKYKFFIPNDNIHIVNAEDEASRVAKEIIRLISE